jgi:hypothetical protein
VFYSKGPKILSTFWKEKTAVTMVKLFAVFVILTLFFILRSIQNFFLLQQEKFHANAKTVYVD